MTTDLQPFEEPWQARLFALTQAWLDKHGDREDFRRQLIAAIAQVPDRGYWESWLDAFEGLTVASVDGGAGLRPAPPAHL